MIPNSDSAFEATSRCARLLPRELIDRANIDTWYILSKIRDYKKSDYLAKLKKMTNQLDEIIRSKEFKDEMSRFIPSDVLERTLAKDKFVDFLIGENKSLLHQVEKIIV